MKFQLTDQPLETFNIRSLFRAEETGALCVFEGWVRNENEDKKVVALEYEAQDVLCQKEAQIIFNEAREQFDVLEVACFHRVGKLNVGTIAVVVAASAKHRDSAFKACRYIIDEIKKRLPIWKKEHYAEGSSVWLNCQNASETRVNLKA